MKIAMVHFLAGVREGGTENIAKNLASRLVKAGHSVDIYTNHGHVEMPAGVNAVRLPYIPMPIRHLKYLSMMLSFSLFASLLLLVRRYDIIHGFFYVDSFMPMIVTKLKRTKSVYTFGGVLPNEWKTGALADKCTALTSTNKEVYSGLGVKDIEIIPNAVDTEKFGRDEAARKSIRKKLGIGSRFTVMAVSRPDEIKGPGLLREIIEKSPGVAFILAGISEAEPLKSMQRKNVFKLGRISNQQVQKYYSAADAFIITSRSEGMPTTMLEALSAGLPVITTKVGGIPDVIDGRVGFFIVDAKTGAAAIKKLAAEKALLKKMSAQCRNHAINYDWKIIAKKYEQLYEKLLVER